MSKKYHGQIVNCKCCIGTGVATHPEWTEKGNPDCLRCGGSGKLRRCLFNGCQEFGCEGHGFCIVEKEELRKCQ